MHQLFENKLFCYTALVAVIALYLSLVIPMIDQVGISFDEQTDLGIAQSYTIEPDGWLRGSNDDATNVRLPMYLSSLFLDLTDNDLYSARFIAVIMGALTILGVFCYCRLELSPLAGLLACSTLAVSPFFLAFSKVAFTEGDSFITCITVWLLYCLASLRKTPSIGWAGCSGICLGIALSIKASAAALMLGTALFILIPSRPRFSTETTGFPKLELSRLFLLLFTVATVPLLVIGGYWLSGAQTIMSLPETYAALPSQQKTLHYVLVCTAWFISVFLLFKYRKRLAEYLPTPLIILGLAGATFLVCPPVHTSNPTVIVALYDIFHSSSDSFSAQFAAEAATLHFLVMLLKPGLVPGIMLWCAVAVALWQSIHTQALRLPVIFFLGYFAFLVLKMPHAQTFYMMPLFPIAAIFLANLLTILLSQSTPAGITVITCLFLSTTYDLVRTYPYTHLNGYQWLGEQYIGGRSTLGYRGVAQTPSDGLEQSLEWLKANLPPGQRVLYFTQADHILQPRLRASGLVYLNGFHPIYTLDMVNYVLVHINADINDGRGKSNPMGPSIYKYYYDKETLERDFRKVYSLKRPFGIEVAAIWFRKTPYNIDKSGNIDGFISKEDGAARHPTIE